MAPHEAPKTPKDRHITATKSTTASKGRSSPAMKKTIMKPAEKVPLRSTNVAVKTRRQRTVTAPATATPRPKAKNPVPLPNDVSKSAKKPLWRRRPLPEHSGVPVPEKMRALFKKKMESLE